MKQNLIALVCGIIFGIGLSLSQMINPNKVLNFLDITGNWDPSLIFVMMGALAVAFVSFKSILKRPAPILAENFQLSGKCWLIRHCSGRSHFWHWLGHERLLPGPAVAGLGLLSFESVIMVIAIYLGFFAYNRFFDQK